MPPFHALKTKAKDRFGSLRAKSTGNNRDFRWEIKHVVNADFPAAIQRTYLEHRLLRSILSETRERWHYAADIGCGFGRNIPVLEEFADTVVGFEREPHFRTIAQALHPKSIFRDFPLSPVDESTRFGFSTCFTFLHHLVDVEVQNIIVAAKKLTAGGYILLVEDTSGKGIPPDSKNKGEGIYIPRRVEVYQEWMSPYKLISVSARPIEATFSAPGWSGAFMLFHDEP